jgi:hypothetical protein
MVLAMALGSSCLAKLEKSPRGRGRVGRLLLRKSRAVEICPMA